MCVLSFLFWSPFPCRAPCERRAASGKRRDNTRASRRGVTSIMGTLLVHDPDWQWSQLDGFQRSAATRSIEFVDWLLVVVVFRCIWIVACEVISNAHLNLVLYRPTHKHLLGLLLFSFHHRRSSSSSTNNGSKCFKHDLIYFSLLVLKFFCSRAWTNWRACGRLDFRSHRRQLFITSSPFFIFMPFLNAYNVA